MSNYCIGVRVTNLCIYSWFTANENYLFPCFLALKYYCLYGIRVAV